MMELIKGYTDDIKRLCDELDVESMSVVLEKIREAHAAGKRIFVGGNGGSAATANHFVSDFGKNAVKGDVGRAKVIPLGSHVEAITAIGNDISFDSIFSEQLKNLMEDGDVVLLISASGNSPNIVKAIEYAKSRNGYVIGFSGFSGGKLKEMSDVCVNVAIDSYEKVEDMHMALTHIIVCYFKSLNLGA